MSEVDDLIRNVAITLCTIRWVTAQEDIKEYFRKEAIKTIRVVLEAIKRGDIVDYKISYGKAHFKQSFKEFLEKGRRGLFLLLLF